MSEKLKIKVGDTINTGSGYDKNIIKVTDKYVVWENGFNEEWALLSDITPLNENSIVTEKDWRIEYNHSFWKTSKVKY